MSLFIRSVPFNFYSFLAVLLVLLIALQIVPDFGPMRTAERRAELEGKVLRDGAVPMMSKELTDLKASDSKNTSFLLNFLASSAKSVGCIGE